ncbi:hypothetical protein BESB_018070 [Besnoitia besnoiti]|uniref:Uncharacterized protein n=1 Tax=Besnoitia besnoiti TaxID=94643 RepID=A0A2A9M3G8_BESBE|nr:hypothetical protein BESB_018070 [Besnoitia besnoiti]PFH32489.1 hypothetical protein BESB_018070 [Besnoitia besnoiti]
MEDEKREVEEKEKKKLENAMKPWFNNRDALDGTVSHPERHSSAVGKYLPATLLAQNKKLDKPAASAAGSACPSPPARTNPLAKSESATEADGGASDVSGAKGEKKRTAEAAGLAPATALTTALKIGEERQATHQKLEGKGRSLLEYATVPQKVKVSRKAFDFSSW